MKCSCVSVSIHQFLSFLPTLSIDFFNISFSLELIFNYLYSSHSKSCFLYILLSPTLVKLPLSFLHQLLFNTLYPSLSNSRLPPSMHLSPTHANSLYPFLSCFVPRKREGPQGGIVSFHSKWRNFKISFLDDFSFFLSLLHSLSLPPLFLSQNTLYLSLLSFFSSERYLEGIYCC